MKTVSLRHARCAGFLLLAASFTACNRQVTPALPAQVNYEEVAEAAFSTGDYRRAVAAYGDLLDDSEHREHALLRLGLIHASADSPVRNQGQARRYLEQVVDEYPGTTAAVEAELLLQLDDELSAQEASNSRGREQAASLTDEVERLTEELARLTTELERVSAELERLKAIDLGRPAR